MHPYVAAGAICAILVASGAALSFVPSSAPQMMGMPGMPGMAMGEHAGGAHDWHGGDGRIPTSQDITKMDRISRIEIDNDSQFSPANGVRSGSGTFEDPFVISDWYVDSIYIHDTTKAFEIKSSYVADILILDWTGQGGYVHHDHINNLRTNRNVARVGDATAAVIEHNEILRVEELRHFDGVVANNTIGHEKAAPLALPIVGVLDLPIPEAANNKVAFNIAGLDGAGIHDNTILGGVDMKIHGHHHSDMEGMASHNHGVPHSRSEGADAPAGASSADSKKNETPAQKPDHQDRYVDFLFYHNTIKDDGFGLRYNDLNHAGDDRKATSEQEPDLELPHVHHTKISILDNTIDGSLLTISTVNADDERHLPGDSATLIIAENKILEPASDDGILVDNVKDAAVFILDNHVDKPSQVGGSATSGIMLQRFRNATVSIARNAIAEHTYGIRATQFDKRTTWSLSENSASGAKYAVYWDNSVPNRPGGDAPSEAPQHGHGDELATDVAPNVRDLPAL